MSSSNLRMKKPHQSENNNVQPSMNNKFCLVLYKGKVLSFKLFNKNECVLQLESIYIMLENCVENLWKKINKRKVDEFSFFKNHYIGNIQ